MPIIRGKKKPLSSRAQAAKDKRDGKTSSSGGGSASDAKLESLKKLQSSLKEGSFAAKQVASDIAKREAQLSGGTYTPSAVVLSKSNKEVMGADGTPIKFEEETFAATKARQEQQRKDVQSMARTQQRTQEALFKKFNLPGQLEREQAARQVASFQDIQKDRLGIYDTGKQQSSRVTPFQAAGVASQVSSRLLSSQPRVEGGEAKTARQVAKEAKAGESVVFSTRTGEVLQVREKLRPQPSGEVSVFVSKGKLAKLVNSGNLNDANKLLKNASLKVVYGPLSIDPVLSSILKLTGKSIEKIAGEEARRNAASYYRVLSGQTSDSQGKSLDKRLLLAREPFEVALASTVNGVLNKLGVSQDPSMVNRFVTSLSKGEKPAKIAGDFLANVGLNIVQGGAVIVNRAATVVANNFGDGVRGFNNEKDILQKPVAFVDKALVRGEAATVLRNEVNRAYESIFSDTSLPGESRAEWKNRMGNEQRRYLEDTAGSFLLKAVNPLTVEGAGNLLIFGVGGFLAGKSAAKTSKGKLPSSAAMEAKLKGTLKKPKNFDVTVKKVGKGYEIEKVGIGELNKKPAYMKETKKVSKVKPSDLNKWEISSDYKFIDKSIKAVIDAGRKTIDLARKVKEAPGKVARKIAETGKRVKTRVTTKTRQVPVSETVKIKNPKTGEFFELTKESIKVEQVPLSERLYLNRFVYLGKLAKGGIESLPGRVTKSVTGATRRTKASLGRIAKRVRTSKEFSVIDGQPVFRNVPLSERLFLDKPLSMVKKRVSELNKKTTSSIKKFTSAVKKIASDVRRKKILKIGKEVPTLRDIAITDKINALESARAKQRLIVKSLAKNSSKEATTKTPFRVVLPKVGARYVTPKLFRRVQSYKKFIVDEFGGTLGNSISQNFRNAGIALKRFDSLFDKLVVDLEKGATIKPTNEAVQALKRFSKKLSKSERKFTRKDIIKSIGKENIKRLTPEDLSEIVSVERRKVFGGLPTSDIALQRVNLKSNLAKAFKQAKSLEEAIDTKTGIGLSKRKATPEEARAFIESDRARQRADLIRRAGGKKQFEKLTREAEEKMSRFGKNNDGKKPTFFGKTNEKQYNLFDDAAQAEKTVGNQVLILKEKPVSERVIKIKKDFDRGTKIKKPIKAVSPASKFPTGAAVAAIFASPKSKLVPILFPNLDQRKRSALEQALYLDRKALQINKVIPSLSQVQKQKQAVASVTIQSPKSILEPVLKPATKTAQALALTSSTLLLSQLIPLVSRGKAVFGSLGEGGDGINTINTGRLKNVKYSYLADLYSVLYGDRATAKQKRELTRPGRKFTGLEARRLVR